MKTVLITGGARSGKSTFAQEMGAITGKSVLFVATATAGDESMRLRIENHKKSRPSEWHTLEVQQHVGNAILARKKLEQVILLDCITLLVSNILTGYFEKNPAKLDAEAIEQAVDQEIHELVDCIDRAGSDFIIVTNEVGLGLVPDNEMGRLYRDLLGRANQKLAARADEVYLLVAGLPLTIKPARKL